MMKKAVKQIVTAVGLLAMSAGQSVWAALPTPVAPSTAPAAGDWIALISGYIKDGGPSVHLRQRRGPWHEQDFGDWPGRYKPTFGGVAPTCPSALSG